MMDLSDVRREYTLGGLRREALPDSPMPLFEKWLQQAIDANLPDPTAMTVATVDENGRPFQRIVLLKHFDEKGLVFYTNLGIAAQCEHQLALPLAPIGASGACDG